MRALAALALGHPARPVTQLAGSLPFARDFDEQLQRGLGVGDDAVVGCEDAADLRRLDVDVDELAALAVDLGAAGVAVGPAVADAEHEVAGQHVGVAVAVAGLQAAHAGHQRMVVGNRAPAHQRGDHRHAGQLGKLHQQIGGVGIDDAAAGHDQRLVGRQQHRQRLLDLLAAGRRLVDRQRLVGVDVELDLGHHHVERQVDQHRARAGPSASGETPAGRRAAPAPARAPWSPTWSRAWRCWRCRPPGSPPCAAGRAAPGR